MEGYRERCYKSFITTHWKYTHTLSLEEYDFLVKIYRKRFKNILPKNRAVKIIDIACGAGHFLYFLQKEGYINACGIDLSKEQIETAQKMDVKNVEQADLFEYLPKYSGTFDVIVANDIIEHQKKEEVLSFLDLVYASLKPGGMVLVGTPNALSLFGSYSAHINFTHETSFTPESLSQVLRVCRFGDVKVYGEGPIGYDLRSKLRKVLWRIIKRFIKGYLVIERGTGRGLWKRNFILEPKMFAIGKKT